MYLTLYHSIKSIITFYFHYNILTTIFSSTPTTNALLGTNYIYDSIDWIFLKIKIHFPNYNSNSVRNLTFIQMLALVFKS